MNTDIDLHVKSDPLPINPVKQHTQFKVGGGHVSLVMKISLHTPSVGVVENVPSKFILKRCILERFGVHFNIILS